MSNEYYHPLKPIEYNNSKFFHSDRNAGLLADSTGSFQRGFSPSWIKSSNLGLKWAILEIEHPHKLVGDIEDPFCFTNIEPSCRSWKLVPAL